MENTSSGPRAKLTAAAFLLIICGFFLLNRIITPPEISLNERRELAKMPEFSLETLQSGKFMSGFEDFAADSFAFRENLRTLKAVAVFDLFFQTDKSGLYRGESGAGKFEPIDEVEYRRTAGKLRRIAEGIDGFNLYYCVIPDKSIYAGFYLPGFELSKAEQVLAEELPGLQYVELAPYLDGGSFYSTDIHWNHLGINSAIKALSGPMGFEFASKDGEDYEYAGEFYGVYSGQLALPMEPDSMVYLSDSACAAEVRYLTKEGTIEEGPVYDLEAFAGNDPYDIFLRGPQPLIWLHAPEGYALQEKTLYIFRDSFSSSLAPALIYGRCYSEVVLIDLRYLDSRVLHDYVEFKADSDVLFLYGSQIFNNSSILKA